MTSKDIIVVLPIVTVSVIATELFEVRPLIAGILGLLTIPITTFLTHKGPQTDKQREKALLERAKRKSVRLEVTDEDADNEEDVVTASDEPDQKEANELNPMVGIVTWSIAIAAIFLMLVSLF